MNKEEYLKMQREIYNNLAHQWELWDRDPVVGYYDEHNAYPDYDTKLFRDFDTSGKIALEYGCGPGRNIIRYKDRFARIDGVDISVVNLVKARENLAVNGVNNYNLFLTSGDTIPTPDNIYDVVFSVICLQHICSHTIRLNIMKEAYRVLKPDGYFCFQIGIGLRWSCKTFAEYFEDAYHAKDTNSGYDVVIRYEEDIRGDLEDIGFQNYSSCIGDPLPRELVHKNWLWVQVQK